jgi:hypothetical protein
VKNAGSTVNRSAAFIPSWGKLGNSDSAGGGDSSTSSSQTADLLSLPVSSLQADLFRNALLRHRCLAPSRDRKDETSEASPRDKRVDQNHDGKPALESFPAAVKATPMIQLLPVSEEGLVSDTFQPECPAAAVCSRLSSVVICRALPKHVCMCTLYNTTTTVRLL